MIEAHDLTYSYYNGLVIRGISLTLAAGDFTAVIGPNGSGKTTLLRLLSGALPPKTGTVLLDGLPLRSVSRRIVARHVAVVPQEVSVPFPFTVRELVEMGRTPHLSGGLWRSIRLADRNAVDEALEATATAALASRPVNELSGGERQRAIMAMALAQHPDYLLLDEPTTHLDIQHQAEVLDLLARLNRERRIAVLATMHDLNLAALYFDRLIMLDQGRIVSSGEPSEVLSEDRVRQVFHASVRVEHHPTTGVPHIVIQPGQAPEPPQ